MIEADNCPFCDAGPHRINVYEDQIKDAEHIWNGSFYIYTRCKTCGCQGPWCYVVNEKTDDEKADKAYANWNKRDKR
jgi:hypothetical protein